MKKFSISFLIVITVVTFLITGINVYATGIITEKSDILISVNSEIKDYSEFSIICNGRLLLPLRNFATDIGVPNDGGHIIWNGKENTVTIKKDSINTVVKVNSNEIKVNGKPVKMDEKAIIYKNKIYVPVKTISEVFGYVVKWDEATKMVLICDKEKYAENRDLLKKAIDTIIVSKKYKINMNSIEKTYGETTDSRSESVLYEVNKDTKISHVLCKVDSSDKNKKDYESAFDNIEFGAKDKLMYMKFKDMFICGKLGESKEDSYNEYLFDFNSEIQNMFTDFEDNCEIISAGLSIIKNSDNEIKLKGPVNVANLLGGMNSNSNFGDIYESLDTEITIDSTNNQLKSISFSAKGINNDDYSSEEDSTDETTDSNDTSSAAKKLNGDSEEDSDNNNSDIIGCNTYKKFENSSNLSFTDVNKDFEIYLPEYLTTVVNDVSK